jgi:hypothetical protein
VLDDPASYAGLLAPINPAQIAFFINQGYSREIIFFLFVDRIRLLDRHGLVIEEYQNIPFGRQDAQVLDPKSGRSVPSFQWVNFECFQNYLAFMIREGFTAQTDIDAVPSGRQIPANRFCADPGLTVWFRSSSPSEVCKGILEERDIQQPFRTRPTPGRLLPLCNQNAQWTVSKADSGSGSAGSSGSGSSGNAPTGTATATGLGPVTVTVDSQSPGSGQTKTTAKAATAGSVPAPVTVKVTTPALQKKPPDRSELQDPCTGIGINGQKIGDPRPSYEMCIDHRVKVQVFLRSAFGVYEYLGKMLARGWKVGLYTGLDPDLDLFTITHDYNYCFVSTSYEGDQYCVPTSAENTKRIFALLRQLVGLNTAVQNPPATLTVRSIPQ